MTADRDSEAARASEPLYAWWLNVIPGLLGGAAADPSAEPTRSANDGSPRPYPVEQMSLALTSAQELMTSLYGACFRALLASQPGEEVHVLQDLVQGRIAGMTDKLADMGQALSGHPERAAPGTGWTGTPLAAIGEALRPLSLNLERAFGGLADAFGLAPLRELAEAGRDMALATLANRQAQVEYLEVVAGAVSKGTEALTARLAEMGERGESVDSLLALVRLWSRTTDEAMHEAMQSPRALEASAKLIRAAARSRKQQQRVVAIASEALNVPTRTEMDDAYREIQELKRELRRSRKATPSNGQKLLATPAATTAAGRKTRRKEASTR